MKKYTNVRLAAAGTAVPLRNKPPFRRLLNKLYCLTNKT